MQVKVVALVAGVAVLLVALPACSRTGSEAAADPPTRPGAEAVADPLTRPGSEAVADPLTLDEINAQLDHINADAKGLDALRVRAEQGNAEAQLLLGLAYGKGEGVPQDYAEAARLVAGCRAWGRLGTGLPWGDVRTWLRRPTG